MAVQTFCSCGSWTWECWSHCIRCLKVGPACSSPCHREGLTSWSSHCRSHSPRLHSNKGLVIWVVNLRCRPDSQWHSQEAGPLRADCQRTAQILCDPGFQQVQVYSYWESQSSRRRSRLFWEKHLHPTSSLDAYQAAYKVRVPGELKLVNHQLSERPLRSLIPLCFLKTTCFNLANYWIWSLPQKLVTVTLQSRLRMTMNFHKCSFPLAPSHYELL